MTFACRIIVRSGDAGLLCRRGGVGRPWVVEVFHRSAQGACPARYLVSHLTCRSSRAADVLTEEPFSLRSTTSWEDSGPSAADAATLKTAHGKEVAIRYREERR